MTATCLVVENDPTGGLGLFAEWLSDAGLTLSVGDAEVTTLTSPYITPKSWSTPII